MQSEAILKWEFGAEQGLLQRPSKENGAARPLKTQIPPWLSGKCSHRQNLGRRSAGFVTFLSWIGGKVTVVFQESQSSAFRFQAVWGPPAYCAQPEVTIRYQGRSLSSSGRI